MVMIGLLLNFTMMLLTLLYVQIKKIKRLKRKISDSKHKIKTLGWTQNDEEYIKLSINKYKKENMIFKFLLTLTSAVIFILIVIII